MRAGPSGPKVLLIGYLSHKHFKQFSLKLFVRKKQFQTIFIKNVFFAKNDFKQFS